MDSCVSILSLRVKYSVAFETSILALGVVNSFKVSLEVALLSECPLVRAVWLCADHMGKHVLEMKLWQTLFL